MNWFILNGKAKYNVVNQYLMKFEIKKYSEQGRQSCISNFQSRKMLDMQMPKNFWIIYVFTITSTSTFDFAICSHAKRESNLKAGSLKK